MIDVVDPATGERGWILITGGSRGIGRGLVDAFLRDGYDVAFTFRADANAASLAEQDGRARGYRCDSADPAAVEALAARLVGEKGAPAAVISNAGITRDSLLVNMAHADWSDVIGANLDGAFHIARSFVPAMIEAGGGALLFMSSVAGRKGVAGQANYAASKAALSGLAQALAVELGRFRIRVNAIAPGYIATDMLSGFGDAQRRSIERTIPLRRLGTAEDVADVAVFLISDAARYVTGQTVVVDGGLTA